MSATTQERRLLEQWARENPAYFQGLKQAIAGAEGTILGGRPGYNILFGGGKFSDFARHPNKVISSPNGYSSAAAGAYQIMPDTYSGVQQKLGLTDFSPKSQDLAMLSLARQRLLPLGGLAAISKAGSLTPAIQAALSPEWASFPTQTGKSYYGQPVKSREEINKYFQQGMRLGNITPPVTGSSGQEPQTVSSISLPKFDFQKAMEDVVQNYVAKQIAPSQTGGNPEEYLALANKLEEEGTEESNTLADIYRQKALEVAGASTVAASDPLDLVKQIVKAKSQEITYNQEIGEIENMLNKAIGVQQGPGQTAPAGGPLTPSKGISIPGVTITSPVDTSGEPGFDFVIGQRGTPFPVPFKAQVLKVVGNQNWETRLETGKGGPRGYGNYIDVRAIDPTTGRPFDVRFAHFDKVNPNIKPGDVVNPGTLIGTQGRTGSTTGAHVSADFYDPDKTTTSKEILQIRNQIRDRLAKGLPVFG